MAAILTAYGWIAVIVPLVLALAAVLLGRWLEKAVAALSMLAPATVLAVGLAGIARAGDTGAVFAGETYRWMLTPDMPVPIGWALDGLSALMLTVVGFVALMVMLFSIGYMAEENGFTRYFALLSLFTASMSALVIADGLPGLFVGWELVGACSYLLIGFWFEKPSASAAAVKAFLTTRVGDVGLLFAIMWVWQATGMLTYRELFADGGIQVLSATAVTGVALLLFVGAAGKSAQFPLHIWLPDAMEGPTPVSALIHAATMVAAGVFLLARTWPLFEASADARAVVLAIGTLTALGAASVALTQTDIKKVLAYSTISQLGFMFAALGAGAWVPAMFHLTTHAAFKALLFLGSGSVIHGSGTQDMREMGGLLKPMPWTAATWIAGAAALAGIPPLAGFFSKDEVIHAVLVHQPIAGVGLMLASLLTAFYITRATRLTFFGTQRGAHAHESGASMLVPLVSLSVLAAGLGFAGHGIAGLLGGHAGSLDPLTAVISTAIALAGVAAGWFVYRQDLVAEVNTAARFPRAWPLLREAYRFDALVAAVIVRPVERSSAWLYEIADRKGIDALVEGAGRVTGWFGDRARRTQLGDVQWYASLMASGFIFLVVLSLLWPQIVSWSGGGR
jgi:NADH-quinone oxidoreductase subunit L